jgi:hypothetical protein
LQEILPRPLRAGSATSDALSKPHSSSSAGQQDVTLLMAKVYDKNSLHLGSGICSRHYHEMHQSVEKVSSNTAAVLTASNTLSLN